jgi:hypothetical protein
MAIFEPVKKLIFSLFCVAHNSPCHSTLRISSHRHIALSIKKFNSRFPCIPQPLSFHGIIRIPP